MFSHGSNGPLGLLGIGGFGGFGRITAAQSGITTTTADGSAPQAIAIPQDPQPTANIGPFTLSQDQIDQLGNKPNNPMIMPIGRLSSTHSDPSLVPSEWAEWLSGVPTDPTVHPTTDPMIAPAVLTRPWLGADDQNHPIGFGNYWFNDSFAQDHTTPACNRQDPTHDKNDFTTDNYVGWAGYPALQQSYRDWMTAFGIQPNQDYFLGMLSVFAPGLALQDTPGWWNHAPVATFTHPSNNQEYGFWLELRVRQADAGIDPSTAINASAAGDYTSQCGLVVWGGSPTNSYFGGVDHWPCIVGGCDSPLDLYLIVTSLDYAKSLAPQTTGAWYEFKSWLGHIVSFIWNEIIKPIDCALVRGLPSGPGSAAALAKMGWVGTAVQLTSLLAQCNGTLDCSNPINRTAPQCANTQPIDCTQPINATNPICVGLLPPPPWYTQWWGIGMIAVAGIFFLKFLSGTSSKTSSEKG
jgi:hypothetical protein